MTGGEQLGHYRLSRLIGAGGMGEVYLARDLLLERDVAIKFVTAAEAASDALKGRLLHEAQAVAAVDHPCICPVYDVGIDAAGRPFMVMQYVEGETLSARLAQGPLPVRDALTFCGQIADALSAAHRRGIVHRDLKPQNIIVTPAGQPKLLDFGIAKILPAFDSSATTVERRTSMTATQTLVGTPGYMSPEQVQQGRLDGRTDLFSLGAILFECLTGRRAFEGPQLADVFGKILHVHPPAPSELRPELDTRHDELCRRLMAKDPSDRFQSADEVVGALRLLRPDTSRTDTPPLPTAEPWTVWTRRNITPLLLGAGVLLLAGVGLWRWYFPPSPAIPQSAERWYVRGTDALREGAFHSAATALDQALREYPQYASAYARLAEARAEIDDEQAATQALVRLSQHVGNESRLPRDERLRLQAIRSLVVRDVDRAVQSYSELARRNPADGGAWLDLGRAQETAGQLTDAQASYERAVQTDRQYAPAHLRLGIIHALARRRDDSLKAYEEAEQLYRASFNAEGEAEVLIRRGSLLEGAGLFREARVALERALAKARAQSIGNKFQIIRAELTLSSVTASQGRPSEAVLAASNAVQAALDEGLDTAAANGLIDLAASLMDAQRPNEAETQLRKAMDLAQRRGARRIEARARLQMAALNLQRDRAADALTELAPALEFFQRHKYRHAELQALTIASRAHQELDDMARAHELASEVLKMGESPYDDIQIAQVLGTLAAEATTVGSLPDALALRERAETIHRRQHDTSALPYDLTNRAELLIRLGRMDEADKALSEVEDGIRNKVEVYVGRHRRVTYLRALAAAVAGQFELAARAAKGIAPDPQGTDTASVLGPLLLEYAEARRRSPQPLTAPALPVSPTSLPPALARERQYWSAAADLARGRARDAHAGASDGLKQLSTVANDELRWRLAAIGSIAARTLGLADEQRTLRAQASDALARLRAKWGENATAYVNRMDLVALRRDAAL